MSRNESKEREDFERWVLPEKYRTKGQPPPWFERHPNGDYINYAIRLQWDSWQARAAIEAARKLRGEPVAYMFADEWGRTKIVLGKETAEHWCPPDENITPLYTAPQPAGPNEYIVVSLRDIKAWRNEWLEANDPRDGTDCVTPFDEYLYDQPAEPEKVPSDDALNDALSNLEHDNYEQSYSGYKNRQADIALIRAALARYGRQPANPTEVK